jgi:hypothetical protein
MCVRHSVAFVGAENERGFNRYGMALIGLVTYGEVIEDIPGETISVRLKRKDGSSDTRKVDSPAAQTDLRLLRFDSIGHDCTTRVLVVASLPELVSENIEQRISHVAN